MLETINGELRTNNYYTGLCRENLLYTPTFEKKIGTHTYEIQCFFVWPVVVLREALKKKNLYYVYKSDSGEAGVKLRSGWVKPENLPREKEKCYGNVGRLDIFQ